MIDLSLDPEKALDAVDSAVKLVKRAMATSSDIAGIAKAVGAQFRAVAQAEASYAAIKSGKVKGDAFQMAADLEVAIFNAKQLREHVKNTVFYPNHIDLWMRIEATEADIKKGQADAERKAKIEAKRKKEREEEIWTWIGGGITLVLICGVFVYVLVKIAEQCKRYGCGG